MDTSPSRRHYSRRTAGPRSRVTRIAEAVGHGHYNEVEARLLAVAERVERVYKRQIPMRWGPDYLPSTTYGENDPTKSRNRDAFSVKLQRYVVAYGIGATVLTQFALMHPAVFEIHEEHLLIPYPHPNPISVHPRYSGLMLPGTSGTVALARKLGLFKHLPRVWKPDGAGGQWILVPWIGDVLLFIVDDIGPYMVSWDIKDKMGQHGKPSAWQRGKAATLKAHVRDVLYCAYMEELRVPIVRLSNESLPVDLAKNINYLFKRHHLPLALPTELMVDLVGDFRRRVSVGDPPSLTIAKFARKGVDRRVAKLVFEQAVWNRSLRVDLFEPIAIDVPVLPERKDPLVVFADWFRRAP